MQNDIQNILERTKIVTLAHQPFFGTGASKLTWEIDNSIDTACTDGTFIKFNEEFLRGLTKEERVGLTVHEVMHVYSKHHLRRGDRDPQLWNVAADYFINLIIEDAIAAEKGRRGGVSCMKLPDGGLVDIQYRDMSTEEIYNKLLQDKTQGSPSNSSMGEVMDAPAASPAEKEEAEREVEVMVEQANNLAKSRGKGFAGAEQLVDSYKKPIVDWRSVIRSMMQSIAKVDYTYQRPHRYSHHIMNTVGSFIPDYHRENVGEIVIALDTSASVSWDEIQQFLGECHSIMEELQPSKVHVVQCDTEINKVDTFEMGTPFSIDKIVGRGGTEFQPVFDWVEDNDIKPMALVYLTDGYCHAPTEPDYPVYWGITSDFDRHLFGEVVSIKFN